MLTAFSFTDKGNVKQQNEDSVFSKVMIGEDSKGVIAIADGMGGYERGEEYSQLAIQYLRECLRDIDLKNDLTLQFNELFKHIHEEIKIRNISNDSKGGTTLTIALIINDKLHVYNIGDTRCYIYSHNKLEQISEDHCVKKEGANTSVLTKCLGMGDNYEPYTITVDAVTDARIIIACDGFYRRLSQEEIIQYTQTKDNEFRFQNALETLFIRGERDNISICILQVE